MFGILKKIFTTLGKLYLPIYLLFFISFLALTWLNSILQIITFQDFSKLRGNVQMLLSDTREIQLSQKDTLEFLTDYLSHLTDILHGSDIRRMFDAKSGITEKIPLIGDKTGPNHLKVSRISKTGGDYFQPTNLLILLIIVWLWPIYRYNLFGLKDRPSLVEKRILNLPFFLFILLWFKALIDMLNTYIFCEGFMGIIPLSVLLTAFIFFLFSGSFMSFFLLELIPLYVKKRIAEPFFAEQGLYRIKKGLTIGLGLRNFFMVFSLAFIPLLLCLFVLFYLNFSFFFGMTAEEFQPIYFWLLPTACAAIGLLFLTAGFYLLQFLAIYLNRRSLLKPLNILIGRMKRVASGDFSCKTSVLYSDEIGQLKGHFNLMLDGLQEREKIKDTFGKYVSMEIAQQIMKSGKVNLAGELIQATILFSDIRDFTPLAEKLGPQELITFLNDYFSYVLDPIIKNHGVVNKFIGDAVMAIYSPVFGLEDHASLALKSALEMGEALKRFNSLGKYPEIRFGIGLHTGILVAGSVGVKDRMEYTVIGDTVNIASRIQTQTKEAQSQVLISSDLYKMINPEAFPGVAFTACDPVLLKGKSQPMVLYKVN
ncbi:MAG: adenylate/guanylate cyclase domain-containing protein [Candidatus Wallbacteria bacterium]|nr:adenylate/guanylate cyclase domain-containing protein [Candidatus Wallbacteria bacterium]